MPAPGRGVLDAYLDAYRRGDAGALAALRHPDFVAEWPQSGERVRGRERMSAIEASDPSGPPELTWVRRVLGHRDHWVVEAGMRLGLGDHCVPMCLEIADDLVRRAVMWHAAPFPAPAARASLVQRFDPKAPPEPLPHEHALSDAATEALVRRYWRSFQTRDHEAAARLRHADWFTDWPQSGERIPSHAADVAIHSAYEGYPDHGRTLGVVTGESEEWSMSGAMVPVRISAAGSFWVAQGRLDYPDGSRFLAIDIGEMSGSLIRRETIYFAERLEAPAWRAHLVERYEPLPESA
jgi:hypothetical protein